MQVGIVPCCIFLLAVTCAKVVRQKIRKWLCFWLETMWLTDFLRDDSTPNTLCFLRSHFVSFAMISRCFRVVTSFLHRWGIPYRVGHLAKFFVHQSVCESEGNFGRTGFFQKEDCSGKREFLDLCFGGKLVFARINSGLFGLKMICENKWFQSACHRYHVIM